MADSDWISWTEAAIESRPHHGTRPTLRRASVEAFAVWYAERQERYARQRAGPSPDAPPDPTGWITPAQAAQVLGRSLGDVRRLIRDGHLDGRRCGRRVWVLEADVDRVAAERAEWVSIKTAAAMLGRAPRVVQRWAEAGQFDRRPGVGRASPSISRASVERLAAELGASTPVV